MIAAILIAAVATASLALIMAARRYLVPVTTRREADALAGQARAWLASRHQAAGDRQLTASRS